jgi:hypothetical protein
VCKVLQLLCLEALGSCPGLLSHAPGPLPDGAASISTLSWLQILRQGPSVVFRLQSSRLTMQAESGNIHFDGLYNFSLVSWSLRAEVCLDGTLQEHGPCWLGLFAGHGAHGAGACRALVVEAEFRHPAWAPSSHLPSQQTGKSRSSTSSRPFQQRLLQHSAMHTTAASVGRQDTHKGVPAHTHTCARTHAHMHAHVRTHTTNTNARAQTHRHA